MFLYRIFNLILLLSYLTIINSVPQDDEGMSLIGLAIEGFNPCADGFIYVEREIGRRPSEENYWDGSFRLKDLKLSEARINLELDNPAVVTVDSEIARVYSEGTVFRIFPFEANQDINFNVKAPAGKPFPLIAGAKLNGKRICKNPIKFKPTILGAKPVALGTVTTTPKSFISYCGRRQRDFTELLINAKPAIYGDWPWHIAIYVYNDQRNSRVYICGGTLISSTAIITAAHCVTVRGEIRAVDTIITAMGKYSLTKLDEGSQERQPSRIIVHEDFDYQTLRNDIAMIKLTTEVSFGKYVQPICLWPENNIEKSNVYGKEGTVVGWGLNENDTLTNELRVGNVTIATDVTCLLSFASFFERFVYNNSLCIGKDKSKGTSPCNGDSGGGFVIPQLQPDNKYSYFLRGIISLSVSRPNKAVCDPDHYVIVTDAAKYLNWINKNK